MASVVREEVQQDIAAAIRALDKDDFENMNIFANRAMANAIFGPDKNILLLGFFLKDVALELMNLRAAKKKPTAVTTAKVLASSFVDKLKVLAQKKDFQEAEAWALYLDFSNKIRKYTMMEIEEQVYKDSTEFMRVATNWIIQHLDKNRDVLLEPSNQFLTGILNELGRIYKIHGVDLRELYVLCLLIALDRVYDYVEMESRMSDGRLDEKKIRDRVFPFIDRIVTIFKDEKREPAAAEVDEVLYELIYKWREAFIHYMEVRPAPGLVAERGVQLPEETRKKISEAISKALEKETRPKG